MVFNEIEMKTLCLALSICWVLPVYAVNFVSYSDNEPKDFPKHRSVEVVNFWATWCAPCRHEMPMMSRWYEQQGKKQGVFMVGIALDSQDNITRFLKETPVDYPIWRYAGSNSRAMMKSFGNHVGVLPYTVVRMPKCERTVAIWGEVSAKKLNQAVVDVQMKCR